MAVIANHGATEQFAIRPTPKLSGQTIRYSPKHIDSNQPYHFGTSRMMAVNLMPPDPPTNRSNLHGTP